MVIKIRLFSVNADITYFTTNLPRVGKEVERGESVTSRVGSCLRLTKVSNQRILGIKYSFFVERTQLTLSGHLQSVSAVMCINGIVLLFFLFCSVLFCSGLFCLCWFGLGKLDFPPIEKACDYLEEKHVTKSCVART